MHRPGLDDRARGRDQPVEALGRGQRGDRAAVVGLPSAIRSIVVEAALAPPSGRSPGASAASSASSRCVRAPRKRFGRQKSTTPALTASPRSTRGTTRSAAYWNGLRAGHARPPPRTRAAPRAAACRNSAYGVAVRPLRPAPARRPRPGSARPASRASASAIEPAAGSSTWSRIAGKAPRARATGSARVERVERRAVVDQPEVRRASAAGSGCAACGRRWSPARRARRRRRRAPGRADCVGS